MLDAALRLNETFLSSSDRSASPLESIELNPGLKFTVEERRRVNYLLELEQSNVISFNDLEYEVASKVKATSGNMKNKIKTIMFAQVIQEMFDKAFSNNTMDYELIFWGYTFAIKKITWFAQVQDKLFLVSTLFYIKISKL